MEGLLSMGPTLSSLQEITNLWINRQMSLILELGNHKIVVHMFLRTSLKCPAHHITKALYVEGRTNMGMRSLRGWASIDSKFMPWWRIDQSHYRIDGWLYFFLWTKKILFNVLRQITRKMSLINCLKWTPALCGQEGWKTFIWRKCI